MRYSYALPALAALTSAKTVRIDVGKDGLEFSPSNAKAEMGDMLEFHFYPMQHSVALGMMDKPCEPMDGGFYSGMMPTKDGEAVSFFFSSLRSTWAVKIPRCFIYQSLSFLFFILASLDVWLWLYTLPDTLPVGSVGAGTCTVTRCVRAKRGQKRKKRKKEDCYLLYWINC